jgi:hypothetical protein
MADGAERSGAVPPPFKERAMSIFSSILDKIFRHGTSSAQAATPTTQPVGQAQPATPAPAKAPPVDVNDVLTKLAATKGGGGNYKTSIVDLLKMLDLDSSLAARKQLAQELNVHAGADGSAEQNIALSKAVMQKLAENGGKVPETMRH